MEHSEEERLAGGSIGGAVRVGATVRRPTGPWTPTIHALLAHLDAAGLDGIPRVLGYDDRGREVLSYLEGFTVHDGAHDGAHDAVRDQADDRGGRWPAWAYSDEVIAQVMAWLARYHAAVASFRPDEPLRWRSGVRPLAADQLVCHNDIAPYNIVVREENGGVRLVGVLDWDVAGPGYPLDDLAFAAWNFVPLAEVERISTDEAARKLRLLASAYGRFAATEVLCAVVPRLERSLRTIRAGAEAGDEGMRNLAASGALAWNERALRELRARLPEIQAALRPGS